MNRYTIAATFTLLALSGSACAAGAGTPSMIYSDGKKIGLADAYAYTGYDPTGKNSGPCPVVALTDGAMDKAALNAAADPWDELRRQQNQSFHTLVVMHLLNDGEVLVDLIDGGDVVFHGLGDSSEVLQVKQKSGERIEGSFTSKNEKDKRLQGHIFWDLHFAADIARTVAAPKAVPVSADESPPPPPPPPAPPPPGRHGH